LEMEMATKIENGEKPDPSIVYRSRGW